MPMLPQPNSKYKAAEPINLPDRKWPSMKITHAPRWLSTDLRDGNQSIAQPMTSDQKLEFFQKLVEIGYKEIEISFPSSGQTDFAFTRELVRSALVPDDVWLQVLSPCRKSLIKETIESLKGAKRAIVHLYLATSPCFQQVVHGLNRAQSIARVVECTSYVRNLTKEIPFRSTEWAFEFSPETFNDSDPNFVLELCEAVKKAWGSATQENPIIFNLPATVEISTPNVFADQVEHFSGRISQRDIVCVSVHPHNDRGCAVAAAELAQMAGADRVEGTLFGNGERTGNVDLVALALNLYTQGIQPNVDLSDMRSLVALVERVTRITTHPRQPYAGELVTCAFSGSHQDAIKKGFNRRAGKQDDLWDIPYLPIDPKDIGRSYEAIIRINSQSGKGGIAWTLQHAMGLDLPRGLQVEFASVVQRSADAIGRELYSSEVEKLFRTKYYLDDKPPMKLIDLRIEHTYEVIADQPHLQKKIDVAFEYQGSHYQLQGAGSVVLSALTNAFGELIPGFNVVEYREHVLKRSSHMNGQLAQTAVFIACAAPGTSGVSWGVGLHDDMVTAYFVALTSALASIWHFRKM